METPNPRPGLVLGMGIAQIVIAGLMLLLGICELLFFAALGGAMGMRGMRGMEGMFYVVIILMFFVPGVSLLITGIGTVRVRPWAWLMGVILSGIWTGIGALMMIGMAGAIVGGHAGKGETIIMAIAACFLALIFVGAPVLFLVGYTRPHVKYAFGRGVPPVV
jgi:hypothetical protein